MHSLIITSVQMVGSYNAIIYYFSVLHCKGLVWPSHISSCPNFKIFLFLNDSQNVALEVIHCEIFLCCCCYYWVCFLLILDISEVFSSSSRIFIAQCNRCAGNFSYSECRTEQLQIWGQAGQLNETLSQNKNKRAGDTDQ